MLFDVSPLDLLVLGIMIILLFGPDKLPEVIQKVTGFLRKVRAFSEAAKEDVRSELGPEFKDLELADLHPKTFVRKHLLHGDGLGIEEIHSIATPTPQTFDVASPPMSGVGFGVDHRHAAIVHCVRPKSARLEPVS